jgi:hypothetical protein
MMDYAWNDMEKRDHAPIAVSSQGRVPPESKGASVGDENIILEAVIAISWILYLSVTWAKHESGWMVLITNAKICAIYTSLCPFRKTGIRVLFPPRKPAQAFSEYE